MSNQSANQTEIKAVEAVGAVSAILAKTKRPYNRKPKLVIVEPVVVVPEPESEDDSSSDEDESSDEEEEEPRSIPDLKTPKITMELPEPEDDESSDEEEEEEEDESDQAEADEVEALSVMTPQDIQARYNQKATKTCNPPTSKGRGKYHTNPTRRTPTGNSSTNGKFKIST